MWQTICSSSGIFMLDFKNHEDEISFYITNLKEIWIENIPKVEVVQIYQDCNPSCDIKYEDALAQVLKMFNEIEKASVDISVNAEKISVDITSNMEFDDLNIEIKFHVKLNRAEEDQFTRLITAPLIQTVYFLEKQQKMLCNLLKQKDRELEEYQMEKGLISRSDLITEKFEEDNLQKGSETLLLNVYDKSGKFMEKLSDEYGEIKDQVMSVAAEPWNERKVKRKIYDETTAAKKRGTSKIVYLNSRT